LVNPSIGETFVIVNPGQGVNNTYDNFYNFLYGLTPRRRGFTLWHGLPADDSSAARL